MRIKNTYFEPRKTFTTALRAEAVFLNKGIARRLELNPACILYPRSIKPRSFTQFFVKGILPTCPMWFWCVSFFLKVFIKKLFTELYKNHYITIGIVIGYLYFLKLSIVDSLSFTIKYFINYILILICMEYWSKILFQTTTK